MIIGITGRSGSGKTTLLRVIEQRGGRVLDCDAIYHRLLDEDVAMLQEIGNAFPGSVRNGVLDRRILGQQVFSDQKKLKMLNKITHGRVKEEVLRLLSDRPSLAAIDAISLHEGGLAEFCDFTVAITAPEKQRITRLMQRDMITEEYAINRMSAQHTDRWFREKCDYYLHNAGTEEEFREKCIAFLDRFCIMKENG